MVEHVVNVKVGTLFHTLCGGNAGQNVFERADFVKHAKCFYFTVLRPVRRVFSVRAQNLQKLLALSFARNIFQKMHRFFCSVKGFFVDVEAEFRGDSYHTQNTQTVLGKNLFGRLRRP